jgi:hypothetical protein
VADELAPMTDWRERVWAAYGLTVPPDWNLTVGPFPVPDENIKPCRPIPCPGSSLGYVDVAEQLMTFVEDYREKMLSSSEIVVYMPQWAVDKLTDKERTLIETSNIRIETRW